MGSLPRGTLCAYCGLREAGYIPDGCAGPLCFAPNDESCFDLCESRGWDYVCGLRYARWTAARFGTLAKSLPPPLDTIGQAVAEFSVRVDDGHMPFCFDEPSSSDPDSSSAASQPASPLTYPRGTVRLISSRDGVQVPWNATFRSRSRSRTPRRNESRGP